MATPSDAKPITGPQDLYGPKGPEVEETFFPALMKRESETAIAARELKASQDAQIKASRLEGQEAKIRAEVDKEVDPILKALRKQISDLPVLKDKQAREKVTRLQRRIAAIESEKDQTVQSRLSALQQPTEPKGLITGDLRSIQADVNIPLAGLFSGVRAEQRAAAREAGRDLEGMRRTIRSELDEASDARLRMAEVDRMAAAEQAEQEALIAARNEETQAALDTARAAQDAAIKQHMDEIDTINQDIRDFKVDQGRAFPDTTSKVAMVIATAMGSLAEGLSQGRLPNTALKLMNDAIDRDIRLQLSELDNMKDAVKNKHNVVARLMSIHGDRNRATVQAGFLAREAMKDRIDSIKTSARSKKAVDAANLAIAELNAANEQARRADIQLNYQMKMDGINIGMQEAQFGIKASAAKASSKDDEAMGRIINTVNALEKLSKKKDEGFSFTGLVGQALEVDEDAKTYENLTTQLTTQLINLSQDRISDADMAIFKKISGGNLYTIIPGQQETRLKAVKNFVEAIARRPPIRDAAQRNTVYGAQDAKLELKTLEESLR